MKLIPATLVLLITVVGGHFLGTSLAEASEEKVATLPEPPSQDEIENIARARALELIRGRVAELESERPETEEEKAARLEADSNDVVRQIAAMDDIMLRTENVVTGLAKSINPDLDPGERDIVLRTAKQLSNDLILGRTLLRAKERVVRREGLRLLQKAAEAGELEAFAILMRSLNDSDTTFAKATLRVIGQLARSKDKTVSKMFKESGLEGELVAMLPTLEGREQRSALTALTALKNEAAVQGWRQIYTKDGQNNGNRISAARSLNQLGSSQEYSQMMSTFNAQLASPESNVSRSAINNIRRLGGDAAKVTLQRALDADPNGNNARSIKRAIRRLEQGDRRNFRRARR